MLTCSEVLAELSNYLDNEVSAELRQGLEEHLKDCPNCWVLFDTTRKTIQIFRGAEPYPLPKGLHDKLQEALRKRMEQDPPGQN